MFKKQSLVVLFLIFGMFLWMGFHFKILREGDLRGYQKLLQKSMKTGENGESHPYSSHQIRHKVSKDIVFVKGEERKHLFIRSPKSILSLNHKQKKTELVESFENFEGWIQDKLVFEPAEQQTLNYIKADHADYQYQSGKLEVKNPEISQYVCPGHQLPQDFTNLEPSIAGQASSAVLFLGNTDLKFEALNFRGRMNSSGEQ